MAEFEKVIQGLERFIDDFQPFCGNRDDWRRVYDALALLKEQDEGITPEPTKEKTAKTAKLLDIFIPNFWCGNCTYQLIDHPRFCPNCGKKVKWDA